MVKSRIIKKAVSSMIIVALITSLAACGNKDVVVEDYGTEAPGAESEESASKTDSTSIGYKQGDVDGLRGSLGERIEWLESFNAGDMSARANVTFDVPEGVDAKVFEAHIIDNPEEREKNIVNTLFGDTSKKIEELKYKDESEYMTLLYKYKSIIKKYKEREQESSDSEKHVLNYEYDPEEYKIIDSSFSEVYKWEDTDTYYIHMYEGEYEGNRFGLIFAYDKVEKIINLFFNPIDIREYFPDNDYKSLLIESSHGYAGVGEDMDNSCTLSKDEIKEKAKSFLESIGIGGEYNKITEKSFSDFDGGTGEYVVGYDEESDENAPGGISMLTFSDSDFVSSYRAIVDNDQQHVRDIKVLAEQEDLATKAYEEHGWDVFQYLGMYNPSGAAKTNITRNGYEVYLDFEPFHSVMDGNSFSPFMYVSVDTSGASNTGSVMITDKGIYGADICYQFEIDDVISNVKLLDFENIKECVKSEFEAQNEKIHKIIGGHDEDGLQVNSLVLGTYPAIDKDNGSKVTFIPVWQIDTAISGKGDIFLTVNAIDGSILDSQVFNFLEH